MKLQPNQRKKLKDAITEISGSFTRVEAERDLIKEIVSDLHEEFQIPKKTLNKIARTYHKQSLLQDLQDHEEFLDLYDAIVKPPTNEEN